jgi:two-component system response regulator MtrA
MSCAASRAGRTTTSSSPSIPRNSSPASERACARRILQVGDLRLDVAGHEVRRGDSKINLTPLEFELLLALALKPQQVFTREMLLEQVWGYHYKADTRLVNVHVQRLRAKVEDDPDNPRIVMTVRGVGYRAGASS